MKKTLGRLRSHELKLPLTISSKSGELLPWEVCLSFLFLTLVAYADTINQYFLMDDFEVLHSARSGNLAHTLLGYGTNLEKKFFRPVPMFWIWVQNAVFGVKPWVYHLTSVLLHAATTIAAANFFYVLFRNLRVAAICGLVFAVFPSRAETVHMLSINFTSWSTLFYLSTLILFAYYRLSSSIGWFILSISCFLAALMSNETSLTLPLLIIVFDFFFSRRHGLSVPLKRRAAEYSAYFFLLFLELICINVFFHTGAGYVTRGGEDLVSMYLGNIYLLLSDLAKMWVSSVKILFAPISSDISFHERIVQLSWAGIVCVGGFLFWRRKMAPGEVVFCFLFVLITVLPILGTFRLLEITHWVRWLYLPSAASCYIISMIICGVVTGFRRSVIRYIVLLVFVIPMTGLTKFYDGQWIRAQAETKGVVKKIVAELKAYPKKSRVYTSGIPWMKNEIPRIDYAFPSAIALYIDRTEMEAALNFLPANQILDLEREEYSEEEWRYFWFHWNDDEEKLETAGDIEPERNVGIVSRVWDFFQPRERRDIEAGADVSLIARQDMYPAFVVNGELALIKLPRFPPGLPLKYLILDMSLKGDGNAIDISRIFWVTPKSPTYSGGRSIGFFAKADGQFHRYRIPLYKNGLSLIDPEIFRFAIRPSQRQGTFFSIRRMEVEYY